MKKFKKFYQSLPEPVTISKREGALIVTVSILAGVIVGMLCSPRKNIKAGCGNGNYSANYWGKEEENGSEMSSPEEE